MGTPQFCQGKITLKTGISGPKTLFLVLFGPFYGENYCPLSVEGGGGELQSSQWSNIL